MTQQDVSVGRGIVLSLICLCLLGMMPIISNLRPDGLNALTFAVAISIWQGVFAFPLVASEYLRGSKGIFGVDQPRSSRLRILLVTLFTGALFGLSTWLYVLGVEKAGAVTAAIAIQAYPLFAILWESLFLKRHKSPLELAITGVLVATLYYLATGGSFVIGNLSIWFLVSLGVPFLWSIAHVIIKEELGKTAITPAQVTFFRVAISAVFLAVLMSFLDPEGLFEIGAVLLQTASIVMGLVYFLELIIWFHAVRHINVSLASSITTPWPALTMVLAVLLLGEAIALYQVVALILVASCIYGLTMCALYAERKNQEG